MFRSAISFTDQKVAAPNVTVYGMKCPRLWDETSPFMGWPLPEMSPFMGCSWSKCPRLWDALGRNVPVYGMKWAPLTIF